MRVVLLVSGPQGLKQQIQLYDGQIAQFGRTEWADFSFPDDAAMADCQFELDCSRGACQLRNLDQERPTRLNGQPIKEALLRSGDRILAGRTGFEIHVEDALLSEPPGSSGSEAEPAEAGGAESGVPVRSAVELCEYLDLSDEARELAKSGQSGDQLLELLTRQELFSEAIRLQAYLLPKPDAVWWACRCVEESQGAALPEADRVAIEKARQWSIDPSEANRRQAEAAANNTRLQSGGAWVAMGAFWSGGSISEPHLPVVEPDDRLTGQALTGALMIAASHGDPAAATQRYRNFLATARKLTRGELQVRS